MGKRRVYALLGFAIGFLIISALFAIRQPHHWGYAVSPAIAFCIACGALAVYVAERQGKVKSIREIDRPLTLFP